MLGNWIRNFALISILSIRILEDNWGIPSSIPVGNNETPSMDRCGISPTNSRLFSRSVRRWPLWQSVVHSMVLPMHASWLSDTLFLRGSKFSPSVQRRTSATDHRAFDGPLSKTLLLRVLKSFLSVQRQTSMTDYRALDGPSCTTVMIVIDFISESAQ